MTSRVWYRDSSDSKLYEPHLTDPPQYLTNQQLFEKCGVRLTEVENCDDEEQQAKIRQEGGYNYFDWLDVSRDTLPNYDERLKNFYTEHLHEDNEIRLITGGSGYFEVRDYRDRWIRLHVQKGDLIELPAGMYHRLTLDPAERIKMLRLYKDTPHWTALNRPEGDKSDARVDYLHAAPSSEL